MRTIQGNFISREIHPQGAVGLSLETQGVAALDPERKRWREKAGGFKKNSDFLLRDTANLRSPHLFLVSSFLSDIPLRASQVAQP